MPVASVRGIVEEGVARLAGLEGDGAEQVVGAAFKP